MIIYHISISSSKKLIKVYLNCQYNKNLVGVINNVCSYMFIWPGHKGKMTNSSFIILIQLMILVTISLYLINGDGDAKLGVFPYMVSLKISEHIDTFNILFHVCGGSLISHKWVLTSASCVKGTSLWDTVKVVDGGAVDQYITQRQRFIVKKVVIHPKFNFTQAPSLNDIALIKLHKKAKIDKLLNIVKLPKEGWEPLYETYDFLGWGMSSQILQHNIVPQLKYEECYNLVSNYMRNLSTADIPFDKEKNVCTGPWEIDKFIITAGDTGGPIVQNGVIYGILSYRLDFNHKRMEKTPSGVFTKVMPYLSWINATVDDFE